MIRVVHLLIYTCIFWDNIIDNGAAADAILLFMQTRTSSNAASAKQTAKLFYFNSRKSFT